MLNSPAHEVDAAVHAHQGTCVHVADQAIVLDWQVPSIVLPKLAVGALRTGRHPRLDVRVSGFPVEYKRPLSHRVRPGINKLWYARDGVLCVLGRTRFGRKRLGMMTPTQWTELSSDSCQLANLPSSGDTGDIHELDTGRFLPGQVGNWTVQQNVIGNSVTLQQREVKLIGSGYDPSSAGSQGPARVQCSSLMRLPESAPCCIR